MAAAAHSARRQSSIRRISGERRRKWRTLGSAIKWKTNQNNGTRP
jgi:hypothetical protein